MTLISKYKNCYHSKFNLTTTSYVHTYWAFQAKRENADAFLCDKIDGCKFEFPTDLTDLTVAPFTGKNLSTGGILARHEHLSSVGKWPVCSQHSIVTPITTPHFDLSGFSLLPKNKRTLYNLPSFHSGGRNETLKLRNVSGLLCIHSLRWFLAVLFKKRAHYLWKMLHHLMLQLNNFFS